MKTVRDQVRQFLAETGNSVVFGNPGSTELPFFTEWPGDVRWVMALQEASAVAMADGYAQASGGPSYVTLHSAAGLGNGLCAVYSAARNFSPVVILTGQQARELLPFDPYLFAQQPTEFPQPYVKWAIEPARAQDVPLAIDRARHIAMQRPAGPVFVSIPMDDWDVATEAVSVRHVGDRFTGAADEFDRAAAKLVAAQRPVLVVGPEVDRDGAWEQAIGLAERTGATVWISPHANRIGFPENHPAFRGQLIPASHQIRKALHDADLVVVLGAPVFTYHIVGQGPCLPAGTELIQLSEDPTALARAQTGTGIRTCLREGITELLQRLPEAASPPRPEPITHETPAPSAPPTGEYVLHLLGEILPADTILVEETPTFREIRNRYLPVRRAHGYYNTGAGGLGWALPASMGIALADPTATVVCLIGDGAMQYSIQSLWTAAQSGIRLIVIVLNNGGYGAMKDLAAQLGASDPPSFDLPGLDLATLARGYGCTATRPTTPEQIRQSVRQALQEQTTTVIDVPVAALTSDLY
ncbi:benzoylformate decarboxylase [Nocardia pseudobrasiliensis]|uniref:acetolactate synthase n=1 Tax=Nocardia pseudobrasiliensis TaxID=45979 RepID=A0A370IE50_9NOCA|nr:benzoylformate decarboxylase [Nocardia pseudobrasiliensis]RDI68411.1 benzoylformate decarboxylase [Nocardia pseudobrasiliensis]